MKKLIAIALLLAFVAFPTSMYAAAKKPATTSAAVKKPMTEKEMLIEMDKQQKIYDDNVKIAEQYLMTIINSNSMTFAQKMDLQKKLDATRKVYLDAAKEMDQLRIDLFLLHNK